MNKKKITLFVIGLMIIVLICTGISFSLWMTSNNQEEENLVTTGCFEVELEETNTGLSVINDYSKTDEEGLEREPYSFSVKNTCTVSIAFKIKIDVLAANTLDENLIKVALNDDVTFLTDLDIEDNNYILRENYIDAGETKNYEFKQWIGDNATYEESKEKIINTRLLVESSASDIPPYAEDLLASLISEGTVANDDPDQNLRFIGDNPNNYVSFNGETWRILGAFKNIKTSDSEEGETRLKLIAPMLTDLAWEPTQVNNWITSTTNKNLNGNFYNNLTTEAKNLIDDAVWHLGGATVDTGSITAEEFYGFERGTEVYGSNPISWTGKVGLMYPSDYAYATGGNETTSRSVCLSYNTLVLDEYEDCVKNNYVNDTSLYQWFINSSSTTSYQSFNIGYHGKITVTPDDWGYAQSPTVYLKSKTRIKSGTGTIDDPYQLVH